MIADASVLVAALVDTSADGVWAEALLASNELVLPELALVEATNILRRLRLADSLSDDAAGAALADLLTLPFTLFPYEAVAPRVWQLRTNLTSYDAFYVAIAEAIDEPLATLDKRLTRAPGSRCTFVFSDAEVL